MESRLCVLNIKSYNMIINRDTPFDSAQPDSLACQRGSPRRRPKSALPRSRHEADEIVMMGAHFDTIPLDDSTKTAVVMASFVNHAAMSDERVPWKKQRTPSPSAKSP